MNKIIHNRLNAKHKGGGNKRPEPTAAEIAASQESVREFNDYLQFGVPLENKQIENWTVGQLNDKGEVKTDVGNVNLAAEQEYQPPQDPNKYHSGIEKLAIQNSAGNRLQQAQTSNYDRGLLASYQIGQGQDTSSFNSQQDLANRHARDVIRQSNKRFDNRMQHGKNISGAAGFGLSEYQENEQKQKPYTEN